jgi:hypothetical protein
MKVLTWRFGSLMLVLLLAVIAAYKFGERVGERANRWLYAVEAHHTDVRHGLRLGEEVSKRVQLAAKNHISQVDFEKEFGPLMPIDPDIDVKKFYPDARRDSTHMFLHRDSFRMFYLRFEGGVLLGYNSSFGVDDVQDNLPTIEERMSKL